MTRCMGCPYSPNVVGMSHKWSLSQLLKYCSVIFQVCMKPCLCNNNCCTAKPWATKYYKLYTYSTACNI